MMQEVVLFCNFKIVCYGVLNMHMPSSMLSSIFDLPLFFFTFTPTVL